MKMVVKFSDPGQGFKLHFREIQTVTEYRGGEPYEENYSVTPSAEAQVLPTKNKVMIENLIINPIPEQYGLVTYDQDKTITIT